MPVLEASAPEKAGRSPLDPFVVRAHCAGGLGSSKSLPGCHPPQAEPHRLAHLPHSSGNQGQIRDTVRHAPSPETTGAPS